MNIFALLLLSLIVLTPACSSRYGKPSATPPSTVSQGTFLQSDYDLVVDELVEFGPAFGFRHRPKGTGRMAISPETITWSNADDASRSFSIRSAVVKSVTMQCVERAGGNVCLELVIATITGQNYYFRDIEWAGGYNQRISGLRTYMKREFPRIVFAEKLVANIE